MVLSSGHSTFHSVENVDCYCFGATRTKGSSSIVLCQCKKDIRLNAPRRLNHENTQKGFHPRNRKGQNFQSLSHISFDSIIAQRAWIFPAQQLLRHTDDNKNIFVFTILPQ